MSKPTPPAGPAHPAVPYVAPFVVFVTLMALERAFQLPAEWFYPIRAGVVLVSILTFSRGTFSSGLASFRPIRPWLSLGVGVAVFLIWIAPDMLFGYRHHWLFENFITGQAASALPVHLKTNWWFIAARIVGAAVLVPVLEELFWRGWFMRWMVNPDFLKVGMGTFTMSSFWITAVLFGSEHGAYWEVGLIAGILYNWLMVRTRNLGDCMFSHAVTNAILAMWVLYAGRWEYWL